MNEIPAEFDFKDLATLRERRYELAQAMETTRAFIRAEEAEPDPDVGWVKRASGFVNLAQGALHALEFEDRKSRQQQVEALQVSRIKLKGKLLHTQGELRACRGNVERLKTAMAAQLEQHMGKRRRIQDACDSASRDLRALKDHLGLEEFLRIVGPGRAERGEKV